LNHLATLTRKEYASCIIIHPRKTKQNIHKETLSSKLPPIANLHARVSGLLLPHYPKIVQERLGHSSIQMTLDTYSHVAPGLQEAAAKHLDFLIVVNSQHLTS